MLLLSAAAYSQASAPLRLVQTVPLLNVHGRIDHFDIDVAGGRLFMSALGNNTLEVFNLSSNRLIRTIGGLHEPQGVTYVPHRSRIFVANGDDGAVQVFDGKTYQHLKTVHLASDADDTRLDPVNERVYVGYGDVGNAGIAVLDGATEDQVGDIKLPAHPEGFQLDPHGSRIYVNIPSANNIVAVVDRNERRIVATWKLGTAQDNFPMALDEPHHRLFIVCRAPAQLLVLDTNSGKIVAKIPCVRNADDVWYDPACKRIFVSGGEGYITAVSQEDADRYRKIADVATAPGGRTSLLAPQLSRLYLGVWGRNGGTEELRVYAIQP